VLNGRLLYRHRRPAAACTAPGRPGLAAASGARVPRPARPARTNCSPHFRGREGAGPPRARPSPDELADAGITVGSPPRAVVVGRALSTATSAGRSRRRHRYDTADIKPDPELTSWGDAAPRGRPEATVAVLVLRQLGGLPAPVGRPLPCSRSPTLHRPRPSRAPPWWSTDSGRPPPCPRPGVPRLPGHQRSGRCRCAFAYRCSASSVSVEHALV